MDDDAGHARSQQRRRRRKAVRGYHAQGQGGWLPASAAPRSHSQIVYDLHQLPRETLLKLRDTLIRNLATFHAGPKPIRLQLCVCLANLAIQMTEWKDVLPLILSTLGSDPSTLPCVLDFLRVLPEEVTHGRKIALTVRLVESPYSTTSHLPASPLRGIVA
jgi:hypothetical protein